MLPGGGLAASIAAMRSDWRAVTLLMLTTAVLGGELQAQTLTFTQPSPRYGAVVFASSVSLKAVASGITPAKVDFFHDGVLVASDTSAPFTATVSGLADGRHEFVVQTDPESGARDSLQIEVVAPAGTSVLAENFEDGIGGWAYLDDAFRGTHQPKYAGSLFGASERFPAMPRVQLGGVDHNDIRGMSGGYVTTFTLNAAAQVQLRFRYAGARIDGLTGRWDYAFEPDEYFDVMASLDGAALGYQGTDYIARFASDEASGEVAIPLGPLAAGSHRLVLGGYANKKTELHEEGFVGIDWVLLETVPIANALPTVVITSPQPGALAATGLTATFKVTAIDADGSIARVQFYPDDQPGGTPAQVDTTPPYSFTHTFSTRGEHTARIAAVDNQGGVSWAAVDFGVGNAPPSVVVTSPADPVQARPGSNVLLKIKASAGGGTPASAVQRVEVALNGMVKGADTSAPYEINVPLAGLAQGYYTFEVRAWGQGGAAIIAYTSHSILVTSNYPPTVALTGPKEGQIFLPGTMVNVQAAASDPDGSIAKVDLLLDYPEVLTDTMAPYAWSLSGLARGEHTLVVVAHDNLGQRSNYTGVTISVGVIVRGWNANVLPDDPFGESYYVPGDAVTVTAMPAQPGMVFDQWTGDVADLDNPALEMANVKVPSNRHLFYAASYKRATDPTLTELALIDADRDEPIRGFDPLYNGAVLKLSTLPTRNLNIRAMTAPEPTGSVLFVWDAGLAGAQATIENVAPYAFKGDDGGNYRAWTPTVGKHTLTVWAFKGANKGSAKSVPVTINVRVIE